MSKSGPNSKCVPYNWISFFGWIWIILLISQFAVCTVSKICGLNWWMVWNEEFFNLSRSLFSRWGEIFSHGGLGNIELEAYLKIKVEDLKDWFVIVLHKNEKVMISQGKIRRKDFEYWIWLREQKIYIDLCTKLRKIPNFSLNENWLSVLKVQYFFLKVKQNGMQKIRPFYYRINTWWILISKEYSSLVEFWMENKLFLPFY